MFPTNFVKTHFMFTKVFSEILVIHEKMWKNSIDPDRLQKTICEGWNFNSGNYFFTNDTK